MPVYVKCPHCEHPQVVPSGRLGKKRLCRQCGYATCLVYAAELREGKTRLERCPFLLEPEYAENRQKLTGMLTPKA